MSALDVFVPRAVEVIAGGRAFQIAPLSIGKLHRAYQALGHQAFSALTSGDIPGAVVVHYPLVMAGMAVALDVEPAFFDALPADEAMALVYAVVEVNADFFARRLLPMMQAKAGIETGDTSSPS